MRFRFVAGPVVALLGCGALVGGCQSSTADARAPLTREAAAQDVASREHPYINPGWREDEKVSDTLAGKAFSATGRLLTAPVVAVGHMARHTADWLSGDRPGKAARLMEDAGSPDNRRVGMNKLTGFGFGSHAVFDKRCRQVAQYDTDPTVRATAIRTLNRARDREATPIFIKALDDKNEWVRLEAAKALANVPDMNAAEPLLKLFGNPDETQDVRVAAADALKHYRTLPVARALSSAVADKNFSLAWQSRRSLQYLTPRDYGYDESAWLAYLTGPEKPFG